MSSKIGINPAEILAVLRDLPPHPALPAGMDALDIAVASMKARDPRATKARVIIYRYDVTPQARADEFQKSVQAGGTPLHDACRALDADLQLIELGSGAVTEVDNARAAAFGMMATEQDTGLLVVCGFGAQSIERAQKTDAEKFLETATPETAAIFGAMVAALRAGIPLVAEGPQGVAAASALRLMRPDLAANIFVADTDDNGLGHAAAMLALAFEGAYAKTRKAA